MNTGSDVLNAAALGAAVPSRNVIFRSALECYATITARLSSIRNTLRASLSAIAQGTAKLTVIRALKAASTPTANILARLSPHSPSAFAPTTLVLTSSVAGRISAKRSLRASLSAGASSSARLRVLTAQHLTCRSTPTAVTLRARLSKHVPQRASAQAAAQVRGHLSVKRALSAMLVCRADTTAHLTHIVATWASPERTFPVPADERVFIVPGDS